MSYLFLAFFRAFLPLAVLKYFFCLLYILFVQIGGGNRIRTDDILLAKQMLYQLSYTPYLLQAAKGLKAIIRIREFLHLF